MADEKPELSPEQETLLETYKQRYAREMLKSKKIRFSKRDLRIIKEIKKAAARFKRATGEDFRIAFDMGRVIVMRGQFVNVRSGEVVRRLFVDIPRKYYYHSPPRVGMIRLVKLLVAALGTENVFLLKGLPNKEEKVNIHLDVVAQSNSWIIFHEFCDLTGFDHSNLIFAERDQKTEICRKHKISCVVDDRAEVLQNFPLTMLNLAFSPVKEEWEKYPEAEKRSIIVRGYREIYTQIFRYLIRKGNKPGK